MVDLSERTVAVIARIFPPDDIDLVESLLREQCGDNLPLTDWAKGPADFDRFRLAAVKLSEGDLDKLGYAVTVAKVDWRDLLVAAGFGHSVTEHERWAEELLADDAP